MIHAERSEISGDEPAKALREIRESPSRGAERRRKVNVRIVCIENAEGYGVK